MPKDGYTKLFSNMINNNKINVLLNTSYKKIKNRIKPRIATIYTGAPDEYFNYKFGKLNWRSLDFKHKTLRKKYVQDCVQINYPNERKYTRSIEIKHVTKQKSNYTLISYEYPKSTGEPYYPVINERNMKKFAKYKKLMQKEKKRRIFFEGRLAQYTYINMDQAIERSLNLFQKIKNLK